MAEARGDVLVRWNQDQVPSRDSLGISTLLVPATEAAAIRDALAKGYAVYVEVEASAPPDPGLPAGRLAGAVVRGTASPEQVRQLRRWLTAPGARVLSLEERGRWPHIRLNWVTKRDDVLQVSSRTAQPWIDTNAALVRIAQTAQPDSAPVLAYPWEPITISDMHQGPALENYLVAIAEAGSFGGDLVLPLHEGFQQGLLLGKPTARADWQEIRRYLEFYSWSDPRRYRQMANVGVVTAEPVRAHDVLRLLMRHNLSFDLIAPERLPRQSLDAWELLIVLDRPDERQVESLSAFAQKGGTVVLAGIAGALPWHGSDPVQKTERQTSYRYGEGHVLELRDRVGDPNEFAMQVREVLGRDRRIIDIWNGITVITAPYQDPAGGTVLVTAVNYAHEPLPVQLRVRGTFSMVHFESPEAEAVLLPFQHRDGYTEVVLPALRIGGRVFLSHEGGLD